MKEKDDGRPQGPTTPRPHHPRPYYIRFRAQRARLPSYSRGEGGVDAGWLALVVARPALI